MSHNGSHDKCGKVVYRPCSSCINSVGKSNGNSIEFSLSIAEQRIVGFIPAWSLAFLQGGRDTREDGTGGGRYVWYRQRKGISY